MPDNESVNPRPAMHGRLPWPTPEELPPDASAVYEAIAGGPRATGPRLFQMTDAAGRLEGPFNSMLSAPSVGFPLQELGAAIRYRSNLSDRSREIAILIVAAERRSDYEWYAHEAVGRNIGLTDEEMAALKARKLPASLDATETVLAELALKLLREQEISDELAEEARSHVDDRGITELVVLIGYYSTLDLLMRTWAPPLPQGVAPVFGEALEPNSGGNDEGEPGNS